MLVGVSTPIRSVSSAPNRCNLGTVPEHHCYLGYPTLPSCANLICAEGGRHLSRHKDALAVGVQHHEQAPERDQRRVQRFAQRRARAHLHSSSDLLITQKLGETDLIVRDSSLGHALSTDKA